MTLKIRKQQMDAFERSAQAKLHQRLLIYLRQELPEETDEFSDAALLKRICEAEHRASHYNIVSDAGIAQFACLTFVAGPTFDEIPEVNDYLTEPGYDTEERLNELVDYLAALENEPKSE